MNRLSLTPSVTHFAFAAPDPADFLSRYLMSEGTDYAQQTRTVNAIDDIKLRRIVCYNQSIYDDLIVELDEYSGLRHSGINVTAYLPE